MAVPVPSINHHNLFYQIQNALDFNRDTCCHLALCLWLLPFHWTVYSVIQSQLMEVSFSISKPDPLSVILIAATFVWTWTELTRQNQDRFLNSRTDCMHAMHLVCRLAKWPNLELKLKPVANIIKLFKCNLCHYWHISLCFWLRLYW